MSEQIVLNAESRERTGSNKARVIRKIEKTIGTPRSNFTASEKNFRKSMRKSVGVTRNIKKGEILKKNDLAVFRPGTGIPPNMLNNLVGMKVQKSIKKGSVLCPDYSKKPGWIYPWPHPGPLLRFLHRSTKHGKKNLTSL